MRPLSRRALLVLATAVAFAAPWRASHAFAASTPAFPADRVSAVVENHLESPFTAGAAVAVVRHDTVVYARGFGVRDLASRAPVDVDTRFEIGSDTKQFTAAAILQLQERGKLSLDDRLAKYAPAFPHANEVTLRQLLYQTTGLFDYLATNHFVRIQETTEGSFESIARMAAGPLHFPPGSRWEYSNTNYIALGRVIEVASGESYDSYIRKHLFAPANMEQTTTIDREPQVANMAGGYWRGLQNTGPLVRAPHMRASWTWSAGEIVSTVGDLAKWDAALRSGKIISAADFALMTAPATLTDGKVDEYGFGWWTDPFRGHKHVYHDGDTYGMSSSNNLYPDDDLTIIVLENVGRDAAARTAANIFETLVPLVAPPRG